MSYLGDRALEHLRAVADTPDLSGTRYAVESRLAEGGMGVVYRALDAALGRPVALKVLKPELSTPGNIARLEREARVIARLEHPGIVPVHDLGTLPDGRAYYVMKLIDGKRLDELFPSDAPLADRLRVFERICETVAFAHAHGVIHRDLKPQNVMVGPFGEVLVLDWGVAKVLDSTLTDPLPPREREGGGLKPENLAMPDSAALYPPVVPPKWGDGPEPAPPKKGDVGTGSQSGHPEIRNERRQPADRVDNTTRTQATSPGAIIGTPAYMAPEQARGDAAHVDVRSDIYALGGILFYLITGAAPLGHPTDDGPTTLAARLAAATPPAPRALRAVCLRALATDPAERYPSAAALIADLRLFSAGAAVSAYDESVVERMGRVIWRYRVAIALVAAYILMRALLLFWQRI